MKINILSLCDGMSCGQIALKELGIEVDNYFASEIYNMAIKVTGDNFPNTKQLGDVIALSTDYKLLQSLPKIDLIIFGFPCRNMSKAIKGRQGYDGGLDGNESWLFYPCADIVDWITVNNNPTVKFFCENVDGVNDNDRKIITNRLKSNYIEVDSQDFTAGQRKRLYWTNILYDINKLPNKSELVLKDILDNIVDESYYYTQSFDFYGLNKRVCAILHINGHDILKRVNSPYFKAPTLTSCRGGNHQKKVFDVVSNRCRKLTEHEYRRLQGIPEWYIMDVAKSHIYNMCGDGWTIDVIKWFFGFME